MKAADELLPGGFIANGIVKLH
ncbi:hypothetical protein EUS_01920 [[Eubacterium] siraeum 70/3]|uniref:Uncharacterized protein n=1 Tax=[Eubacterium] siraeum 70/3 TaxID=657319 RepID=D4JR21_9FIRM|nr:hypothetical protein EUS_01920 [[Eubacterium] siraeum 70/3]